MELKPGYKQTDLGVIPEDWDVFPLSKCAKRITDGEHLTPRRSPTGYYLLSARNILNGHIDLSDVDHVEENEYRRIRQRCNPELGDVLISCSGTVGRVATVPDGLECVMVRSAALVKPDPEKMSGVYAQYFLQSTAGQKQILASLNQGAQANLFQNHIQALRVPLPPTKAEQLAVATALGDMDALLDALAALIAKKRELKEAAMQQLLTGQTRLPGFSQKAGFKKTEVGIIPEDWGNANLGDKTTKVGSGITPTGGVRVYRQSGRPFLRSQNIGWGQVLMEDVAFIDDHTHESFKATEIKVGDVFLNITGASIGRSAVADTKVQGGNVNQHVCIIRPKAAELNSRFLNCFLLSSAGQLQIDSFQAGGNRQGLNFGQIRSFQLPLPRLSEQTAIATVLSDLDAEIAGLEQRIAKSRALKQGMMQELLTGRIRLV